MIGRYQYLRDLAQAVDVSPDTISKWFSGEWNPSLNKLERLCDALGTTVDQIVEYLPEDEPGTFDFALAAPPNGGAVGVAL
jgi:transcriptional regulator with XRE-family HTH domain